MARPKSANWNCAISLFFEAKEQSAGAAHLTPEGLLQARVSPRKDLSPHPTPMPVNAHAAHAPKAVLEPFAYHPGPLGPREVEIAVTHCGICHSDVRMIDNDWTISSYPLVPGHEVIGTVVAAGSEVPNLRERQRVGVGWQCGSCGACEYCSANQQNYCASERDTIVRHHGGFADRVRCDAAFAIPLPEALESASAAPLLCAGTTVFTPMLHLGLKAAMRTAVVGVGGLGHLAVQFLAKLGCEVTAISMTRSKEKEARSFGAADFIAAGEAGALQAAQRRFDFILSTVPADLPWPEYLAALRPEGTFCIVGIPQSDIRFPALALIDSEKRLVGGRTGSPADIATMLRFAAHNGVKAQIEKFPMNEANRALDRVRSGEARYRVVLEA
jgi:alcohol/geraniol dehydrogenase (NADP+)